MTTKTTGDQPLFAPEQTFSSHTSAKNILIAVDDSDESARALHYVGALLRDIQDVNVTLFHVLNPMPRELMEHGGSENPETEHHLGEQLRKDQEECMAPSWRPDAGRQEPSDSSAAASPTAWCGTSPESRSGSWDNLVTGTTIVLKNEREARLGGYHELHQL